VHRVGPALSLCPLALLYGLRFYRRFLQDCDDIPSAVTIDTLSAVNELNFHWQHYLDAIARVDSEMWPKPGGGGLQALESIVRLLPRGRQQWWLFDGAENIVIQAMAPEESELTSSQWQFIEERAALVGSLGSPVTIISEGLHLRPSPDAKWRHAAEALVQRPLGGWERLGPVNPLAPRTLSRDR
jgi:hypothetical protein